MFTYTLFIYTMARIRLTENEMIGLLEEIILLEAMSLEDIHAKYYSDISKNDFDVIVGADPTSGPNKKGKYTEWLLNLYKNGKLKNEDLYKASDYLEAFHKFKNRIQEKDIRKYNSLPELYRTVKPFIDNPDQATSKSDEVRKIKGGAEKVYEDERWLIIVPHTMDAAIYYGKGTQWCTAASESENYFDKYVRDYGDSCLFINIDKARKRKYQFCFDSEEFMDETDDQIEWPIAETIGLTPGALKFYEKICGDLLTLRFNPSEIVPIDDLDGYYLTEDYQTIIRHKGNDEYEEVCTFPLVDPYLGSSFDNSCIKHRFIPVCDDEAMAILNIFDLTTKSFIFKSDDYICDIRYFNDYDYIICKRFVDYHADDPICSIFSLDKMKFICDVPKYNLWPLNVSLNDKSYYKDSLLVDFRHLSVKQDLHIFDGETGNEIAKGIGQCYSAVYYDDKYPDGKVFYFLALNCPDKEHGYDYFYNTIVLYDGTLMDFSEFIRNKQNILKKYIGHAN